MPFCRCSFFLLLAGPTGGALAAQAGEAADLPLRLELRDGTATLRSDLGAIPGTLHEANVRDGILDLRDLRAHATFGPDIALGIRDDAPFVCELELRTRRGEFGTALMCRAGGTVHYGIVVGRAPGVVTFEPWSWMRDKLPSRARLDDGAWHECTAVYDPASRSFAWFVDGELQATCAAKTPFHASQAPALRLGHNLDPSVQQPFGGEVRSLHLARTIPPALRQQLDALRIGEVLPAAQREAALSAWWAQARRARPPQAWTAADWQAQARRLRAGVQDALGLWPPPYGAERLAGRPSPLDDAALPATDFATFQPTLALDVRTGGTLVRAQHSVTRLYWQTFAGYFASGWLYLPQPAPVRPVPAILCPHGHWENGARHPVVQSRCVALAQQGYVVLAVDSVHLYDDRVGLSPLSVMTWNNLRALEVLRARADVDRTRIGCTGASGGAQQTYYLTALDTDLAAAAPAVMACHFEDILSENDVHCACNHVPHLLRAADMPQMAAAFAPRPQFFLTVTGDWTKRFPQHGYPAIRGIYELFRAHDAVSQQQWEKGHTYDQEMREAAYAFFARWLRGAEPGTAEAAPKEPTGGAPVESLAALQALDRRDVGRDTQAVFGEFAQRLGAPRGRSAAAIVKSLRALFERDEVPMLGAVRREREFEVMGQAATAWSVPVDGYLRVPTIVLRAPATAGARARVAVLLHPRGAISNLAVERAFVSALLAASVHVVAADVRYTGELDLGNSWREPYGRFVGLDEGVLAVRDVRHVVAALPAMGFHDARVAVVGLAESGAVALFAAALDERIACAAAPQRGTDYRTAARRPAISRILLHGDLDDACAVLGGRALIDGAATAAAVAAALQP